MKLFDFISKKPNATLTEIDTTSVSKFNRVELPVLKEEKSKEWVGYGLNNLYPNELMSLTETSAIHNAIIKTKSTLQAGDSIIIEGTGTVEGSEEYIKNLKLNDSIKLGAQIRQFDKVRHKLSFDFQTFGAYAFEIIYSLDFTRILEINHVNVSNIRSGKYNDKGEVDFYYYSRNWKDNKIVPEKIKSFNPADKTHGRQLVYRYDYSPRQDYYGVPSYQSALSWIKLDSEIGLFHLSNIENGFFPSLHMAYYKKPASNEEKQMILNLQKQQFKGADKAGKVITTFSDGKDLAPEITPIQVSDLDKQFILIGESCVQQIISAHRVTSPMLLGVATSGKLGYSNELDNAFKIFENTVIAPDRLMLEQDFNKIIGYNGFNERIELNEFNPLQSIGTKDALITSIGIGGTQALQGIIESQTLTYNQKLNTLTTVFGISEEQAIKIVTP